MSTIPPIAVPRAPVALHHPRQAAHTGNDAAGNDAKIQKSAEDFTAVALGEMLTPMFDTMDATGGNFGGGGGEAAWKPMLVQEFAKAMAHQGGLGLTTQVAQAMLALQEKRQ
jgi:Rod binding domain-containing protein